jgi:PAS domain S-box-containing protein
MSLPIQRISRSYSVLTEADRVSTPAGAALAALLVGITCYLGGAASTLERFPAFGSAVLFPPYVFLLAGLLVTRPRFWWTLLLASALAQYASGYGVWSTERLLLTEGANWVRALVAVVGLRRLSRRPLFNSLEGVAVFFAVAVVLAPAIAAFIGAAVVVRDAGGEFWPIWEAWALSTALTALTLLPPLMIAITWRPSSMKRPSLARVIEGTTLALALAAVSSIALMGNAGSRLIAPPDRFVAPLPLLLWAAVRFGPVGTSLSILLMTLVAVTRTMHGIGPFTDGPPAGNMIALQGFLAILSMPLVMLAALVRERERVTEALHSSQHRYRLATTAGGVAVWDWTLATNELYVDDPIRASLGYDGDEVGHQVTAWQKLLHVDDAARISVQALLLLDGTPPSFEAEYRMMHKDGSARWFLTRGAVVLDGDRRVRGLIGTQTDITERKHAEQSLRESEERTSLAANAANLGFWQRDLKSDVLWLSEHARRIYGLPPDTPVTRHTVYEIKHADDRERVRSTIDTGVTRHEAFEIEFRVVLSSGEMRWLNMQGRPRLDDAGTPIYLGGVVMDVTERKQLALAAEEEHKELAHLGRVAMVGELSTALAHELNQPLTAILSNAQAAKRLLALDPTDLEQIREILDDIVRDDARAAEVIRQLRLLIQKADAVFVPLRVPDLASEAVSIVRSELLTRGVSVETDFAPSLPTITGDRVQLLQVLLNLILNACDAMHDADAVDRRLTISARAGDRTQVVISVADRGTGIAKGQLERVFEPFVTTKAGGLGLGLAICRSIVNAHEGKLTADNNPEGGAVFHLALPTRSQGVASPPYPRPRVPRNDVVGPGASGDPRTTYRDSL